MIPLPRAVRRRMLLRSFLIQGSWNYETLIGTGFAFCLLPLFRYLHPADPAARAEAMRRHSGIFNSHPYLSTVAIGAIARQEMEAGDPLVTERFKSALRGALGSLGDRLVWSVWRPASMLLALVLILAGAAWWVGILAFLLVYNLFHLTLRSWGLKIGTQKGLEVGKVIRDTPIEALVSRAGDVGAFLCGMALVMVVVPQTGALTSLAAGLVAAAAGLWLGLRSRQLLAPLVGLVWILAIAWGLKA